MSADRLSPRRAFALGLAVLVLAGCAGRQATPVTTIPVNTGPAASGAHRADGAPIANLTEAKDQVVVFHESGEWERQINSIADEALLRLDDDLGTSRRPAIVLDIDDTALSTFAVQRRLGFGWVPSLWDEWVASGVAPAHPGVLALYRYALERGVAVFFVTGRREHLREPTVRQLRAAGYGRWVQLYLKPDDYDQDSVVPYKSGARREIEEQGFDILLNVGDQWSDLEGGHARATFKLPNPMYYRP